MVSNYGLSAGQGESLMLLVVAMVMNDPEEWCLVMATAGQCESLMLLMLLMVVVVVVAVVAIMKSGG